MSSPQESYVARVLNIFESCPDRDAVVLGEQRISYAAARETVLRLANALRHQGLAPGERVALLVSNRPEAVLLQLAVHLIGCRLVFVPPEPAVGEQVAFLQRAETTAFVYHPHLGRGTELAGLANPRHVFTLGPGDVGEDLLALGERMPAATPDDSAGPEDVSTVFYTGGTTGRPKLVLHRHPYYTGLTFGAARRMAECPTPQRFLIPTLVTHSSGHISSLTSLLAEGTAVLMERFDPGQVIATIQRERITSVVLHPPMLYQVLDHPDLPGDGFPTLIRLHYGGAPTAPARILQAMARFGTVLRQTYGMTEVPVITLLEPADHTALAPDRLGSCGKPLAEMVEVSVRDSAGEEVRIGEVGEVCVRGRLVMAEYWRDPEQTRETMSGGWLHTGDLGRFDQDGYLYLVDRAKDVIISGLTSTAHNVYSNLLEDALTRQPGVRMAAAIGLPDDVYGEIIHAVCVAEPGMTVDVEELQKRMLDELGEHYVPESITFVDNLPWTAIGKVDKKVLRRLVAEWRGTSKPAIDSGRLQVATQAAGVWLSTDEFEAAVERVRADVIALFSDQVHRSVWAPPVIAGDVVARTGYPNSFPHILGEVSSPLGHTDLNLTAAACHHVYPLIAAQTLPSAPVCLAVEATCFRNEATAEPGRLRSFRMREIVFVADPDTCLRWRDASLQRARKWLTGLGIGADAETADDPFFGPVGRLMRVTQRQEQLKWELIAPVGDGLRQAVASSNYHKDHFSSAFGFHGPNHQTLHSSCMAFGLERLALALVAMHGPDVRAWPSA